MVTEVKGQGNWPLSTHLPSPSRGQGPSSGLRVARVFGVPKASLRGLFFHSPH